VGGGLAQHYCQHIRGRVLYDKTIEQHIQTMSHDQRRIAERVSCVV
jgi:hypothetical protein